MMIVIKILMAFCADHDDGGVDDGDGDGVDVDVEVDDDGHLHLLQNTWPCKRARHSWTPTWAQKWK